MNQTPPGTSPPPLPPRTAAPPPKKRMHGCLIALIVALCLMVPVVGILAAIAIPAYNDYVARAKVAQAMGTTMALRWRVVEFREREERCPVNGDAGFSDDDLMLGPPVAAAVVKVIAAVREYNAARVSAPIEPEEQPAGDAA